MPTFYRILADLTMGIHCAYVTFVVLGLVLILLGLVRKWQWVRNFWFRVVHFLMIAVVVAESFGGITCPLTDWENQLRVAAGDPKEPGSFMGRLVHDVMFMDLLPFKLPAWAFTTIYCVFGAAVLLTLILAPPRRPGRIRRPWRARG